MDYMQDSLKKQPLTVQDFIAAHPGEAFHLMTPGGYVDLTVAQAAELLTGQSMSGHPGCPSSVIIPNWNKVMSGWR